MRFRIVEHEGTTEAVCRLWNGNEGWGVLDSPETPGGCWTHFSHIDMAGYRSLDEGQRVQLQWRAPGQDGYDYAAVRVIP